MENRKRGTDYEHLLCLPLLLSSLSEVGPKRLDTPRSRLIDCRVERWLSLQNSSSEQRFLKFFELYTQYVCAWGGGGSTPLLWTFRLGLPLALTFSKAFGRSFINTCWIELHTYEISQCRLLLFSFFLDSFKWIKWKVAELRTCAVFSYGHKVAVWPHGDLSSCNYYS